MYLLCVNGDLCSVSSIYNWSENSSPKSEAKDGGIGRQFQSLSIVCLRGLQRGCRNLYFDFNLKNKTMVL